MSSTDVYSEGNFNINTNDKNDIYPNSLLSFTACDIADALLKLQVPNAGFIPNLQLITAKNATPINESNHTNRTITVAPASTVIFCPKTRFSDDSSSYPQPNIPSGMHWVDLTPPGTTLVISQPENQKCAVLGGIMALRIKYLKAKGVVVSGRVRDTLELASTGLPIWAKGISIVGAAAEARPLATQVALDINGTIVKPGDLVVCDSINGVVVIPQQKIAEVVALLPKLTSADEHVKMDVTKGISVSEAFAKHRG